MEVGIEDCLHIEFEYDKSTYALEECINGKIFVWDLYLIIFDNCKYVCVKAPLYIHSFKLYYFLHAVMSAYIPWLL